METRTRKEQIRESIERYTRRYVLERSFTFDECNAFSLSLDLHLDRSNVSRLLNQMFSEASLIKMEGRPTRYLSRKVMEESFPFVSIPSVIKKGERIESYISYDASLSPTAVPNSPDIIGARPGGSLYAATCRLLSLFLYPADSAPVYVICGEYGSGRKYYLQKLFALTRQMQKGRKNKIFFCEYSVYLRDPLRVLQELQCSLHSMIAFEMDRPFPAHTFASTLSQIRFYYQNHGNASVRIAFLITPNADKTETLRPYAAAYIQIPSLAQRPNTELLAFIAAFFQEEANRIQREIRVSAKVIQTLACTRYPNNCQELRNEILHAVANSVYQSGLHNHAPILVDASALSLRAGADRYEKAGLQERFASFPSAFTFWPDGHNNMEECLSPVSFSALSNTQYKANESSLRALLLDAGTSFDHYPSAREDSAIWTHISNLAENTVFAKDPLLIQTISDLLRQFIENRIIFSRFKADHTLPEQTETSVFAQKITHYIGTLMPKLIESEKFLIHQMVRQAFDLIDNVRIPVLIVCHGTGLAKNYADHFNRLADKRLFYALDYSAEWQKKGIRRFAKHLHHVIGQLNRGNGILLLVDRPPLTNLDSSIVMNLKISLFSVAPVSASLLYHICELTRGQPMDHIVTMTRSILYEKNRIRAFLRDNSMIDTAKRRAFEQQIEMSRLFPSLHTNQTCDLLYKLIRRCAEEAFMSLNNTLIADFIFQGNCILEQIMKKEGHITAEMENKDEEIIKMLQAIILSIPELASLDFNENDLALLADSIYNALQISDL